MTDLIILMQRADRDFTGADEDARLYAEPEIRKHATHVIELLPPTPAEAPDSRGDRYPGGLLAVLEDPGNTTAVSVVVFRFHSGKSRAAKTGGGVYRLTDEVLYPPVYEVLFTGVGFDAPLRELRHTDWGEAGYIHYPDGPVIAEAFRELGRWFDGCAPAPDVDVRSVVLEALERAPTAGHEIDDDAVAQYVAARLVGRVTIAPCADNKHDLPSTDVGTRCPCGRVVVCDDGVRIDGRRGELAGLSPVRSPGVISTTWTLAPKEPA